MARIRRKSGARNRFRLTLAQWNQFSTPGWGDDDPRRKAAWFALRDQALAEPRPGERPEAFWDYEGAKHLRRDLREEQRMLQASIDVQVEHDTVLLLARLQWLARSGQLSAAEVEAIKNAKPDGYINDRRRAALEAVEKEVVSA